MKSLERRLANRFEDSALESFVESEGFGTMVSAPFFIPCKTADSSELSVPRYQGMHDPVLHSKRH